MRASIVLNKQIRIYFSVFIFCWAGLHVYVLYLNGFNINQCLQDSIISNIILAAACYLLSNSLSYYRPQQNQYGIFAWSSSAAALVVFLSNRIQVLFFKPQPDFIAILNRTMPVRFGTAFLLISCCALVSVIWYNQLERAEQESRNQEAERLTREAELFRLHQQLQPHFLFNSLNSISALIGSKPVEARKMIHQLSDFLRGTLKRDQEIIALTEEINHLQLYLEIEKVRFGHRLRTEIEMPEGLESLHVPAMLLQPVVENAIKFGLYGVTGEVLIKIVVSRFQELLCIRISNPFDSESGSAGKGAGFGLKGIERRLYLLFGRNDLLEATVQDDLFITLLKIPQLNTSNSTQP